MLYNSIPHRFRSQAAALIHDLLMVPTAWLLAFWLRLESLPAEYLLHAATSLAVLLPLQLTAFVIFGLYRGVWRFASLPDLIRIIKATIAGTATSLLLIFLFTRLAGIPRSVPIIYTILLILLLRI